MCNAKNYLPGGSGKVFGMNFGDPLDLFGKQKAAENAKAVQAAKDAEAARQAQLAQTTGAINAAFAGREPQYAAYGGALRDQFMRDLNLQTDRAARQSKFGLAKAGLTGGSAAIDEGRELQREAAQGGIAAEGKVQQGVSALRSADESARQNLINQAVNGGNVGDAAAESSRLMAANARAAQGNALTQGLGDVFGGVANTYRARQDADALRRGFGDSRQYVYGTRPVG